MIRVRHNTTNFVVRHEVIGRLKEGDFDNTLLNMWCHWAISKYDTEVLDLIIDIPDFIPDIQYIKSEHLVRFVFFNDIKRFEFFIDKVPIKKYPPGHGYDGSTYSLMKDICWYNKIEFLKLIIDIPELDFTRNEYMIIHKTFQNGHYEILSILLQNRPEIPKEIYDKYSHVLRSSKLKQLQKRIYTCK